MPENSCPPSPLVCSSALFADVMESVRRMELDDRLADPSQFFVISQKGDLKAFCRSRKFEGFSELCTLGVLESARGKGYAQMLVDTVAKAAAGPVYLVTVIPAFFEAQGFTACDDYPAEIAEKLAYCKGELPVEDEYVVMLRAQ